MSVTHRYETSLVWSGSTAAGYRGYDRTHRVSAPPAVTELDVSADPSFRGDPDHLNPEQLLVAAASSCQLLSFLAVAARAGIDVLHYEDDADAVMPVTAHGVGMRITTITLRPQIVVATGAELDSVLRAVHTAHDECFIANTLNAEITIDPTVEFR